jgi:hypothetical protein
MLSRLRVVVAGLLTIFVIAAVPQAQVPKAAGAATPQEVVAAVKKATAANDFLGALQVVSPAGLKSLAGEGVTGVLMVLAFSDPDDPMPGNTKPSKAELDAQRKKYKDAMDMAKALLKPYGLDAVIGKPVLAADTQKNIDTALDKADNLALITSLYTAMVKLGPLVGMTDAKPRPIVEVGTVSGYKITGDKATAQNDANPMAFTRIAGRWYMEVPASGKPGDTASSASDSSAKSGSAAQSAAAPRAAAAGTQPEIVVGGVQIARVAVSKDDFSAQPFHADNGTTIVLWVKMPAGQGLISIDEDTSVLQSVTDDKGSSIGGKYGAFPHAFKDGSGGTIEIASSGFAAPGATAILAEGTLTMSVAAGTKKTRVPGVKLQNGTKLMLGTTPMTVAGVNPGSDALEFTLKLPRQVMVTLKNVVFLDAKGDPIDSHSTGDGYANDSAEMSFSIKTGTTAVTIEFEAWQGLRTIKLPFKVKAGLGLGL